MESIVVCSGGFDPIHSGHLAIINEAYTKYNKKATILLNSDAWLVAKKGKPFMSVKERRTILENLSAVEEVIEFDDSEGNCCKALEALKVLRPGKKIIFCNGGDRNAQNIPEMTVSGIEFEFGIGGDFKMNSSSTILNEWQHRVQDRTWGSFRDLFKDNNVRVKELIVAPGSGISYQRHQKRSEFWVCQAGGGVLHRNNRCFAEQGTDGYNHALEFQTGRRRRSLMVRQVLRQFSLQFLHQKFGFCRCL